ncbi:MAG: hypothetical protein V9E83_00345 [Baekduia sp.]
MLRDLLTPKPFRGDVVAAGVVVLLLAAGLFELRAAGDVEPAIRALVLGLLWAFVVTLAWRSPVEGDEPRPYQSVLWIAALLIAALALAVLAEAFGADPLLAGDGSRIWVLALLTAHAMLFSRARGSGVGTLLAAAGTAAVVAALYDAVLFHAGDDPRGLRWLLLAIAVLYALNAVRLRDRHRRHAVAFAEAAGLVLVGLAFTWTEVLFPFFQPVPDVTAGAGWTFVLLAGGLGLVGYGGVDRERGPIWIGALVLLHFCALESDGGVLWWPLLLLVAATPLLLAGLRPSTPAPPSPDEDRPVAEPLRIRRP